MFAASKHVPKEGSFRFKDFTLECFSGNTPPTIEGDFTLFANAGIESDILEFHARDPDAGDQVDTLMCLVRFQAAVKFSPFLGIVCTITYLASFPGVTLPLSP